MLIRAGLALLIALQALGNCLKYIKLRQRGWAIFHAAIALGGFIILGILIVEDWSH